MRIRTMTLMTSMIAAATLSISCGTDDAVDEDQTGGPRAVLFEIGGPLSSFDNPSDFLGSGTMSQHELETLLARAARDIQVQEIVLHFSAVGIGWGRGWDLSDAISRATESGKPVTCHIEAADNLTYWIAARSCPKIIVAPAGGVDLVGLSLESIYLKDMLDSLAIEADMLHIGRYKSAAETLTRNDMSPEAMEASRSILDRLNEDFVSQIAAGRKMDPAKARDVVAAGPYSAKEAKAAGLVDEIRTMGSILDELEGRYAAGVVDDYGKEPPKPITLTEIMNLLGGGAPGHKENRNPRIALIPAVGPIVEGSSGDDILSGMEVISDMDLVAALGKAGRDDSIKAVVLRIDSPGGGVLASDNIWEAVTRLARKKPVVASMGDVAASGGYYIASAATEIFASPSTLTGSIGVVGGKVVIGRTLEKIGVHTQALQTAPRATIGSPFRPFTDEERVLVTGFMQEAYDLFVDRVATSRSMPREKILSQAEGRVWTGADALKGGLVDRSGTLHDAVERARKLIGSPGLPVEVYPEPKSLMDMISEQLGQQPSALSFAKRHPAGRHALAMAAILGSQRVVAFCPVTYEVR